MELLYVYRWKEANSVISVYSVRLYGVLVVCYCL
jgi:hypothetical protein